MDRAIIFILLLFFVACSKDSENTETSLPKESKEQFTTEEEAPAEETPAEETVEEAPAEETVEEAPAEKLSFSPKNKKRFF